MLEAQIMNNGRDLDTLETRQRCIVVVVVVVVVVRTRDTSEVKHV